MSSHTSISADKLSRLIGTAKTPVLIDVRTEEDFAADTGRLEQGQSVMDDTMRQNAEAAAGKPYGHGISFGEAFRVWLRVAVLSFGGPAGQIAVMHRILVEEKNWISESRFLHALNYCMLLPGPEAQQLATYIGRLRHRTAGGIMVDGLFILPGIIAIMGLGYI